jgi:hypothetical protein
MFNVALDLVRNQGHHDNYVREVVGFEAAAKSIAAHYWRSLQGWNGVPVSVGGVLERAQLGHHGLRSNRDQLRGNLTRAVNVLKKAAECSNLADEISGVDESLCSEVDAAYDAGIRKGTESAVVQGFSQIEVNGLRDKAESLDFQNKQILDKNLSLEKEKKELEEELRELGFQSRLEEMKLTFKQMEIAKALEEKENEKKAVAGLLGDILSGITQSNADLEAFKAYTTIRDMVDHANKLIVNRALRDLSARKS